MTPLGVQLYSVRDQLTQDRSGTLRRIAELGYDAVEPYDPLNDPAGFRALVDEYGLSVCSTHAGVLGDARGEILDAAGVIGVDTVIVPAVPAEEFADRDGLERTAGRLNEAAAEAAGRGIRIGYHNHYWEFDQHVDGRPSLEVLADLLNPEVILEIDVYWAAVGGADQGAGVPDLLRRLGGRVRYLHVKDGPATRKDPMTAVGSGVLPIPDILAAAPDAWRVVELDECATDMFDALADSRSYLTGLAS
ncbi:MAG: sugar phosphate isomerase/epimerase [Actinocatenispora sp.]